MLRSKTFIILLTLFFTACAESNLQSELSTDSNKSGIVGGMDVVKGDLHSTSVVMIYGEKESGSGYICTGAFISENVVLTAAHCVIENVNAMTLMFGTKPFSEASETRLVKAIKIHESYHANGTTEDRNDLALIFFEGGLPQGAKAAPLAQVTSDITKHPILTSYGYGRTDGIEEAANASDQLGVLRKVDLEGSLFSLFNPEMLQLKQDGGSGVCFGDSGGPLFSAKGEVIGVASGVDGEDGAEDTCKYRSYFTYVRSYRDWIIKNMSPL